MNLVIDPSEEETLIDTPTSLNFLFNISLDK